MHIFAPFTKRVCLDRYSRDFVHGSYRVISLYRIRFYHLKIHTLNISGVNGIIIYTYFHTFYKIPVFKDLRNEFPKANVGLSRSIESDSCNWDAVVCMIQVHQCGILCFHTMM